MLKQYTASSLINSTLDEFISLCSDGTKFNEIRNILENSSIIRRSINKESSNGQVALIAACEGGHHKIVGLLLDFNANPYTANRRYNTIYSVMTKLPTEKKELVFEEVFSRMHFTRLDTNHLKHRSR